MRKAPFLILLFFAAVISAQEAPYGLDARQPNNALLLESSGYALAPMQLRLAFPHLRFTSSLHLTHADDGTNRLFVVERGGQIRVFANSPDTESAAFFLDLRDRVRTPSSETGLLSMAFHPRYADNGLFYIFYTTGNLLTRVSEFRVSADDAQRGDPQSERVLLDIEQPAGNHNGGQIAFGPDGFLYIGLGDGGRADDFFQNGQDPTTLLGSILRIDIDKQQDGLAYAIPADNPFVNGREERRREIWAWGLRNPWRFSFDRLSGDLWVGDVGQDEWEEINLITAGGGNFGWDTMEGNHCFRPASGCDSEGLIPPVHEYDHSVGRSVTGGFVYRGKKLLRLQGAYIYGDFVDKKIWALRYINGTLQANELIALSPSPIASFGEDEAGEVYVVGFDGLIYELAEKDAAAPPGNIPSKLSASGLYSNIETRTIAPGIIPYSVNTPFWSDGTDKERFLALPGNAQIGFSRDGAWNFPAQSVLVKNFYLAEQIVETRFLVKHPNDSAWDGYSYMWDEDGRDATLLQDSATRTYTVNGREHAYYFPSRSECLVCHTAASGYALGLRTDQLNGEHNYGTVTDNQLRTLNHIDLFSTDIGTDLATLPRLPNPANENASVAARARAYLDVNCAFCHSPGGSGRSDMDLRFTTPLAQMRLLDVPPRFGNLGLAEARRVKSGDPLNSILLARMLDLGRARMPNLASLHVDEEGTRLLTRWIEQLGQSTAVTEAVTTPQAFALAQNFPNPFNASTIIRYELKTSSPVSLVIYDMLGRPIKTLVNAQTTAGAHAVTWDGTNKKGRPAASGIYLYRLHTSHHIKTRRMALIR